MAEDRHVVISCDCHAVGRPDDYTPYIEPAYRDRYEDFLAHQRRAAEAVAAATAENRRGRRGPGRPVGLAPPGEGAGG
jgi:hypothetical protein